MMDGLSVVTGVITLVTVVVEVVKKARTFYQASEEFEELLEQIEQFTNALAGIDDRERTYPSNVITILGRARTTLENLKILLETKIVTKLNSSSRIRRRAWAKSRSKIYRIQSSIKEDRLNLVMTLTANKSALTIQPGTTSKSISQDVGCSTDPLISFRTQLSNIQESVSKTHDAVMIQKTTVDSVLQSLSGAPRCHTNATNEPRSNQYILSSGAWCKCPSDHDAVSRRLLSPEPMTPLEASRNFFAESYTVNAQVPISSLVAVASFEQVTRVGSRTNVYTLFHLSSFRRWQWLTVSVQIPWSSRYWAATKIVQRDKGKKCVFPNILPAATLPYSLLERIQDFLCQKEEFNDNTRIDLFLSERDTVEWRPRILHSDPFSASCQPLSTPCEGLTYLHDLGCRRYDESEVVQIKIVDPPKFFCSSLNGLLVYEVKFKDSIPAVGLLYTIRVLHCMNGSPGFTKLIGIVTDNSRRYLKSYLIEFPKVCRNILQMAADPSVSWERREQWAAQLVRGISRLHAHSFLVGGLHTCNIPLIDDTASVQFWSFKERFETGRKVGAYYPPEFLYIRDMSPTVEEADSPYLTSKTDIFHLGLMLWLLAENKPRRLNSPICDKVRCNERENNGKQKATSAIYRIGNRSHFLRYREASPNTSEISWTLVEEKIPVQDLPQEKYSECFCRNARSGKTLHCLSS